MITKFLVLSLIVGSFACVDAQTPAPIVVQAANQPDVPIAVKPVSNAPSSDFTAAIRALQELKVSNEETLKKQQVLLEQLDELQKAAEQLKVFAHRG